MTIKLPKSLLVVCRYVIIYKALESLTEILKLFE